MRRHPVGSFVPCSRKHKIAIAACVNRMAETGQSLNCYPIGANVVPTLAVPNPAG